MFDGVFATVEVGVEVLGLFVTAVLEPLKEVLTVVFAHFVDLAGGEVSAKLLAVGEASAPLFGLQRVDQNIDVPCIAEGGMMSLSRVRKSLLIALVGTSQMVRRKRQLSTMAKMTRRSSCVSVPSAW